MTHISNQGLGLNAGEWWSNARRVRKLVARATSIHFCRLAWYVGACHSTLTVHKVSRIAFAVNKLDKCLQIWKYGVWAIVGSFGEPSEGIGEHSFSKALASGTIFSMGLHYMLHSFEEIFLKRVLQKENEQPVHCKSVMTSETEAQIERECVLSKRAFKEACALSH